MNSFPQSFKSMRIPPGLWSRGSKGVASVLAVSLLAALVSSAADRRKPSEAFKAALAAKKSCVSKQTEDLSAAHELCMAGLAQLRELNLKPDGVELDADTQLRDELQRIRREIESRQRQLDTESEVIGALISRNYLSRARYRLQNVSFPTKDPRGSKLDADLARREDAFNQYFNKVRAELRGGTTKDLFKDYASAQAANRDLPPIDVLFARGYESLGKEGM